MEKKTTRPPMTKRQVMARRRAKTLLILAALIFLLGFIIGRLTSCSTKADTEIATELGTVKVSASDAESTPIPEWTEIGEFDCFAYDACTYCCGKTDGITKTGTKATANRTVAVDPEIIPLGSTLLIDGQEYIAEDIGGKIKGNKIDIFHNTHDEALDYGKQTHTVYIKAN